MPRWSRPPASQANWFALATAIAVITVVFCGGGLGGSAPADGEGGAEPLALTLSAPEICEASHPKGYRAHNLEWDEEEEVWRDVFFKWWSWPSVGTMEVGWAVNGGDAPYTVMIAGETYSGASGTAEVSCALEHGPVFDHPLRADFERIHPFDDKPVVDSGIKTVMATVTDGSGATVEAAVDVYALLSPYRADVLRAGETYRVQGWLVTVPGAVDMRIGSYETATCEPIGDDGRRNDDVACEDSFDLNIETEDYEAWVSLGVQTGTEQGRRVRLVDEHAPDATTLSARVHATLDELAASVGESPRLPSGAEPLALTLSAPEICEASHPKGYRAHNLEWDEEEEVWRDVFFKWWSWPSVGTMEVGWAVNGGDAPYTVMIAGETYSGASGTAEVSCALEHGPILDHPQREVQGRLHGDRGEWGRIHSFDDKPVVDSGIKTVMATVTDGSGATVEAAVDVYALLSPYRADVLRAGETYRIRGWLMTIPDEVEGRRGGLERAGCTEALPRNSATTTNELYNCEDFFQIELNGRGFRALLGLGVESGEEGDQSRFIFLHDDQAAGADALRRYVHAKFDQLIASLGQPPKFRRE